MDSFIKNNLRKQKIRGSRRETRLINSPKFIVDINAGKLAKWLRIMGYDAALFDDGDDSLMIATALDEDRIIVTRDTQIMKRRIITSGQLKAILLRSDKPEPQLHQVMDILNIGSCIKPFSICLECNQLLVERSKQEVKDLVPPYVFKTQSQYMECPNCHRIYWRGTHWQAMNKRLDSFIRG